MYNNHDRPSTQRMLITAAAWIAGIAAVIALAAVIFGVATSHNAAGASKTASTAASTSASVQSPATATANVPTAQPAPAAAFATQQVAPTSPTGGAASPKPATPAPATTPAATNSGLGVVVIDAGHEAQVVPGTDPIGPGSSTRKAKILSGAYDSFTHTEESQRNLDVALRLQSVLQARGVTVVMIRTKQNVHITNRQRAGIANNAHAALFIRLHCDSGPSSVHGILMLEPSHDWYPTHRIVAQSAIAAKLVMRATLAATGAYDRGFQPRNDEVGFNYSQVPSILIEMGLLSNRTEAIKLSTPAYQTKLADGMANGIVTYLKSR